MFNGIFHVPQPVNEPVLGYTPGSPERAGVKARLAQMLVDPVDVPMVIGGEEIRNGDLGEIRCPHDHQHLLGTYHKGDAAYVGKAIEAANAAKSDWGRMPWDSRAIVFLKAAELLADGGGNAGG